MRIEEVIRRPLLSEKSTEMREANMYAFVVASGANKVQVRQAVETQFSVKVAEVRIANMHGKLRRQGRHFGHRPDWKKAYVRLAPGEKTIDFFEGA